MYIIIRGTAEKRIAYSDENCYFSERFQHFITMLFALVYVLQLYIFLWTPAQRSLSEVHVMFCECYFLLFFMAALCSDPG